ncbi:hypothetical protein ABT160_10160 [Streptomyces sp. NPDC001941]|uniref:hypothetical protein n=1 Tax=Streptomyces sp. NPDC001941 TaxID=3154659 RepID=UPI00331C15C4
MPTPVGVCGTPDDPPGADTGESVPRPVAVEVDPPSGTDAGVLPEGAWGPATAVFGWLADGACGWVVCGCVVCGCAVGVSRACTTGGAGVWGAAVSFPPDSTESIEGGEDDDGVPLASVSVVVFDGSGLATFSVGVGVDVEGDVGVEVEDVVVSVVDGVITFSEDEDGSKGEDEDEEGEEDDEGDEDGSGVDVEDEAVAFCCVCCVCCVSDGVVVDVGVSGVTTFSDATDCT